MPLFAEFNVVERLILFRGEISSLGVLLLVYEMRKAALSIVGPSLNFRCLSLLLLLLLLLALFALGF